MVMIPANTCMNKPTVTTWKDLIHDRKKTQCRLRGQESLSKMRRCKNSKAHTWDLPLDGEALGPSFDLPQEHRTVAAAVLLKMDM